MIQYDPQGNLQIWTGTGWETIPKIAAGDLSYVAAKPASYFASGDQEGVINPLLAAQAAGMSFKDAETAAKYGNLGNIGGTSTNWLVENPTQDAFNLTVKSGDKAGSQVQYKLQDGQWVPTYTGDIAWDTNSESNGAAMRGIGSVLAAAAAGYGIDQLGLLGNSAPQTWGVVDESLSGLTGSALPSVVDTGTMSKIEPLWGLQQSPMPGTVAAGASPWEATIGGFSGTPFGTGLISTGIGGAASGVTGEAIKDAATGGSTASSALEKALTTPSVLKALGVVAGGLLGKSTQPSSQSGTGTQAAIPPSTIPQLYGGNDTKGLLNWGAMGPTETERRMRMQYLPGLLGAGPWSV